MKAVNHSSVHALARLPQEGEERGLLVQCRLTKRLGCARQPPRHGPGSHPAHWWRGHRRRNRPRMPRPHSGVVRQSLPVVHLAQRGRPWRPPDRAGAGPNQAGTSMPLAGSAGVWHAAHPIVENGGWPARCWGLTFDGGGGIEPISPRSPPAPSCRHPSVLPMPDRRSRSLATPDRPEQSGW